MGRVSVTQQQLELLEENEKLSNFPAVLSLETFGFSVILQAPYLGKQGGGGEMVLRYTRVREVQMRPSSYTTTAQNVTCKSLHFSA